MNNIALIDKLKPFLNIIFAIIIGYIIYLTLNIIATMCEDNKKRKRKKELKLLYTARKRKFEGNPEGWKKWRDANYKITDLVEASNYY